LNVIARVGVDDNVSPESDNSVSAAARTRLILKTTLRAILSKVLLQKTIDLSAEIKIRFNEGSEFRIGVGR
jgi:hypothetical protein